MAGKRRAPPNRMTFYLEGDAITADRFLRAVTAFFELLADVTEEITGSRRSIRWIVSPRLGSFGVNADPQGIAPRTPIRLIADTVIDGIHAIARDPKAMPDAFNEAALRRSRDIAQTADGKIVSKVRVVQARRQASLTHDAVERIDRILGDKLRDYGTVEGRLQMISVRGGAHFAITDPLTERSVQCAIDDERLDLALAAFRKRVLVSGPIRYDAEGFAVAIAAEELEILPEQKDLPTFDDVYGLFAE